MTDSTMHRILLRACWVTACLSAVLCGNTALAQETDRPQKPLSTLNLRTGLHLIKAEVAVTPEQHQKGLMHRQSMGGNEGMLFVFDRPGTQCFWMKNTLIPLQVAFIGDDGTVINLAEMKPKSLDSHCSSRPVRFVLEMNTGWFTKRGVKPGSQIRGEPFGSPR